MSRSRTNSLLSLGLALLLPSLCAGASEQQVDTARVTRIEISLAGRRLLVTRGSDTVYDAQVAVGSGRTLKTPERTWNFRTPVGVSKVVAKEVEPLWVPPDWHYVELAHLRGLRVERLGANDMVVLSRNRLLVASGVLIGLVGADSIFHPLPPEGEIVFDGTLFIPPFGSAQRRVAGVLGPYRLLLANGVGLHGTSDQDSIGKAATHGCIRLGDEGITWLYENIPIGTTVVVLP